MDLELFLDVDSFGAVNRFDGQAIFRGAGGRCIGLEGVELEDDLPVGLSGHRLDRNLDALFGELDALGKRHLLHRHVEHELVADAVDQGVGVHLLDAEPVGCDLLSSLPARA